MMPPFDPQAALAQPGPPGAGGPMPMGPTDTPPDMQGAGPGAGPARSVTSKPTGDHTDTIRHAIELLNEYQMDEEDDEDLALVSKIQADLQKLLANNTKLQDQAMGAGPGAKFLRKQQGAGGGGGGY